MGGSVFTSGSDALYTPRMPPAVYLAVRDRCHAILRELFIVVASPIDGPGKLDFGDVDVLVALPKDTASDPRRLLDTAIERLGPVRASVAAHDGKASIAIPWPAGFLDVVPDMEPDDVDVNVDGAGISTPRSPDTPPAYIQVDIAIVPSLRQFHWSLFKHGHGDFWNIIGSAVLRPLGFTVDERALWLRVPEIEQAHRNRAKVYLSDDPAVVLSFLHLPIRGCWDAPFPSAWALFAYCTTCRFFVLPSDRSLRDGLKANDRRRLHFRPLFRQWATEYVPAQRDRMSASSGSAAAPVSDEAVPTRESARDAAFDYFPGSQARFEAARTSWLRERHLLAVRTAAKAAVPATLPSRYRGEVCAAVRRHLGIVMADAAADPLNNQNRAAEEAAAAWTVESVAAYVRAEWAAIATAAIPKGHAQYLASLEAEAQA
ncbi:hypothetical protein F503_07015 [Ophiostoma piceae UAMH 11346]|uniref:Uncharacterized protein n=1 Tax=Ophiostoma piceae (strain UAMH 11346) TaxID=1262450 RepID=S3C6W0_OPHP1|nr:hypothetical protein F503_07015 [Ophiostoma piceae UAMH 11346]